ncbi:MAG: hypothetical protein KatS3mg015_0911 [Fimbriimonadales bacterium]|nr:MAG: hypothetical protein KatS3mg015_0911 [Fimbriimonadales bacterium]
MDLKRALSGQYRAGLTMLRQCIERCPEDVWESGVHPRTFWRIAYHALFYTHFYLQVSEETFQPWEKHRQFVPSLWGEGESLPPVVPPYSRAELLDYLGYVYDSVDEWLERMDLDSPESGFHWYRLPKLDHQILNVRHLQGHVGQLQEILYARGVDLDWVALGK